MEHRNGKPQETHSRGFINGVTVTVFFIAGWAAIVYAYMFL